MFSLLKILERKPVADQPVVPVVPAAEAVVASVVPAVEPPRFGDISLGQPVMAAVAAMGYTDPTPIQIEAIPRLLAGRDIVGRAQTGTGKTAAFGIPIVERVDPSQPKVQAIVLVPTRELAIQVSAEIGQLGANRGVRVLAVYGGERIGKQIDALRQGVPIVVGTPGRVLDHLRRGTLRLNEVQIVILDEADEMLDIGFADDIEAILRRVPKVRQTALFSATIPPFVRRLIRQYLVEPQWVDVAVDEPTVAAIEQVYYEVAERDKLDGLCEVLGNGDDYSQVLVFRRTQIGVDKLASALQRRGYPVEAIHGGLGQAERNRVMRAFREGDLQILVATNVAARGLDIKGVSHVVNYDFPDNPDEYVHRIGRTGRAGKKGKSITFVAEWDLEGFEAVKKAIPNDLRQEQLKLYR